MGGPIGMNIGMFQETSMGLSKIVVSKVFLIYSQNYVSLNIKSK